MKMKGLLKIACIVPAVVMAVASGAQSPSAGHKGIVPAGDAFLEQLQKRDSVLIADQLRYGFRLENVKAGTALGLPDLSHGVMDSIEVVSDWKLDTLKFRKKKNEMDLEGSFVITSFDEGNYRLPDIAVGRMTPDGTVDTLVFKGMDLQVMSMPVDTATYKPHDIKGQIRYRDLQGSVAVYTWRAAVCRAGGTLCLPVQEEEGEPGGRRTYERASVHRGPQKTGQVPREQTLGA